MMSGDVWKITNTPRAYLNFFLTWMLLNVWLTDAYTIPISHLKLQYAHESGDLMSDETWMHVFCEVYMRALHDWAECNNSN